MNLVVSKATSTTPLAKEFFLNLWLWIRVMVISFLYGFGLKKNAFIGFISKSLKRKVIEACITWLYSWNKCFGELVMVTPKYFMWWLDAKFCEHIELSEIWWCDDFTLVSWQRNCRCRHRQHGELWYVVPSQEDEHKITWGDQGITPMNNLY